MMNVRPRPRPQLLAPPAKKRKINSNAPAEITFDPAAREEYLTGFHKRKEARKKHAQEENAKKEKEEKLKFRKELRQQRKEDLERHVAEVNMLLRRANGDLSEGGEDAESEEEEEWQGFADPIVPEEIDREEEYIDEDKYTTVTIESVGISKDGFEKVGGEKKKEDDAEEQKKQKRVWTIEKPKTKRPTAKKKKFRYESPADRKAARMKIGAKNRASAQARKASKA
ncbi:hypothetical protein K504DRAFT_481570 [Pleomassaria siparia CBS 279.74]|uniref:Ribosomal RNA-processing protein 17 n=1 Tax=Pleomassaria siparia CBS 279.74 TaxID=1314801 RepID=A0A6G1KC81_9PLEO|nr:hypothetical protein K504DRAFT_481570 [Pleomassaria siparia CBS 279.74]